MSSSQPFIPSSPLSLASGTSRRRRSRFTYRHLSQLGASSVTCPLRVIAHIDLDAFYAQCEMVRLGVRADQPLAVQQWQNLIAINYPAREFGLSRHVTATEARRLCPELVMQHVATWKEGEDKWAYHDDAAEQIGTHKVSLDPYRTRSREILALIKSVVMPPPLQRVEKAGIDEVFVDLSAQVHHILLERYPELGDPAPYDDPCENLPRPPTTALDWNTDALVDLDATETEDDDPDWDDIAMLIGSEIVRSVRAEIKEQLHYTCSAGIAQNKMLSKLGSAHKKPNQQTIVRNRAIQQFLSGFKFTKIRNLGGKLGEQAVAAFGTDTVKELLEVSLEQLKKRLGDESGVWIHQTIRGIDHSEVNSRTQIKSMLSAKSFRPSISTFEQAVRWLRIFIADIFSRLVEEGVLDNKRRPKSINLFHRGGGQTKSRQAPIPQGGPITEVLLFDLSKNLLCQIIAEGNAWPCANLSLSVAGFEDGITGNRGIGSFLVKGDEAKAMNVAVRETRPSLEDQDAATKRRKTNGGGIQRFFARTDSEPTEHDSSSVTAETDRDGGSALQAAPLDAQSTSAETTMANGSNSTKGAKDGESSALYICDKCHEQLRCSNREEHDDWHFAEALQRQERGGSHTTTNIRNGSLHHVSGSGSSSHKAAGGTCSGGGGTAARGSGVRSGPAKPDKGQTRLTFGR